MKHDKAYDMKDRDSKKDQKVYKDIRGQRQATSAQNVNDLIELESINPN